MQAGSTAYYLASYQHSWYVFRTVSWKVKNNRQLLKIKLGSTGLSWPCWGLYHHKYKNHLTQVILNVLVFSWNCSTESCIMAEI